jgi:DNA-binding response OmpR family regulator
MTNVNVLVLGRERHLVAASTAVLADHGFAVVGVSRDEEAAAYLDRGTFAALIVGSGVEQISRPPLRQRAARHGTAFIEARRDATQSVQDNVRDVIIPQLQLLVEQGEGRHGAG